jgi:hypothetical protein
LLVLCRSDGYFVAAFNVSVEDRYDHDVDEMMA